MCIRDSFNVLTEIEDYSSQRLQILQDILDEYSENEDQAKIPAMYLRVGIAYLKDEDKIALFRLSKEERKVFQERVIDKRMGIT